MKAVTWLKNILQAIIKKLTHTRHRSPIKKANQESKIIPDLHILPVKNFRRNFSFYSN